jgi:hypothetical protein
MTGTLRAEDDVAALGNAWQHNVEATASTTSLNWSGTW